MSRNVAYGLLALLVGLCDSGFAQNRSAPTVDTFPRNKNESLQPQNGDQIPTGQAQPVATSFPQPSDRERAIDAALNATVEVEYDEVPLRKVLKDLGRQQKINILLDRSVSMEGGIEPETPVTISLSGVRFGSALKLILEPLKLAYSIKDEVLVVAPRALVEQQVLTKVYSTAGLAATPDEITELSKALEQTVKLHATFFEETGGKMPAIMDWYGHAVPSAQALVITNNRAGHALIEELLDGIRQAAKQREYPNRSASYHPLSPLGSSDKPIIPGAAISATPQRTSELLQP